MLDPSAIDALNKQIAVMRESNATLKRDGNAIIAAARKAHASPRTIAELQQHLSTIVGLYEKGLEVMAKVAVNGWNTEVERRRLQAENDRLKADFAALRSQFPPDEETRPVFFSNIREAWAILRGRPTHG